MDEKQYICKTLTEHCDWLNEAHKDKAKHKVMEKTIPYQRYIGEMEELNKIARKFKTGCSCKEIKKGGKHIGHRMVKI